MLWSLTGATVNAYQDTYPTAEQRKAAAALAGRDITGIVLYGRLDASGAPALTYAWELGAIAGLFAAVGAVLIAVALTRAAEDEGTLELVRVTGIDPRAPLRAAFGVLTGIGLVLGIGCAIGVGAWTGRVDGVTWAGAACFGAVIGVVFVLTGLVTALLAQVVATAGGARIAGLSFVAAAFALRAVGDVREIAVLQWLTPLGLRATVRPFAADRGWVVLLWAGVAPAVAWAAEWLSGRREYRSGLIRRRNHGDARLPIRSGFGLTARLLRGPVLVWTVTTALLAGSFCALGSNVVAQENSGDLGGFLGAQLGTADPVSGYLAYCGTVVGIMVTCFAVLAVLRARTEEEVGLTDHVLVTGVRRWGPLAWRIVGAGLGSLLVLAAAAALSSAVAPAVITGDDVSVRAAAYVLGQWPSAVAVAGWAAFLVGTRPRLAWLSWAPVLASVVLALLGRLLGVPQSIVDLGVFQHVPDVTATPTAITGIAVLLVAGAAGSALGLVGVEGRDLGR
jgi:polyether ionophore transport system permease protein